jgi:hydrogenase/urease accessory protein HupE
MATVICRLLVLLVLLPATAIAHILSVSYSHLELVPDGLESVYRLPLDDMDLLLLLDQDLDEHVSATELENARDTIANFIADRSAVNMNGRLITPELTTITVWQDKEDFPYLEVRVHYYVAAEVNQLEVTYRFLTELYPDHRTLAEFSVGGDKLQFVSQHENTWSWQRDADTSWSNIAGFVLFGMEHIFSGYDHLLFLLGLLLVGRGLKNLVRIVTAFTVAHSVTLALATLGIVQPAGWFIEAAIALSIVYVGVENLLVREVRHRWRIAFVFGLVHGFGFAGLLREMNMGQAGLLVSLLTFNAGVEIGQVLIVALAWPLLHGLQKSSYRLHVIRLLSVAITVFGLIWFVERVI